MLVNVNGLNLNALNEEKDFIAFNPSLISTYFNRSGEAENKNRTHHHPQPSFEANWAQNIGNIFRPNNHQNQENSNTFPSFNFNEIFNQHRQEMTNIIAEFMEWYKTRTPRQHTSTTPSS